MKLQKKRALWLLLLIPLVLPLLFLPSVFTTKSLSFAVDGEKMHVDDPQTVGAFYAREATQAPDPPLEKDLSFTVTHHLKSGFSRSEIYHIDRSRATLFQEGKAWTFPDALVSSLSTFLVPPPTFNPLTVATPDQTIAPALAGGSLYYRTIGDHWQKVPMTLEHKAVLLQLSDPLPALQVSPSQGTYTLKQNGKTIPWHPEDPLPLPDREGKHAYVLEQHFDDGDLRGNRVFAFDLFMDLPPRFTLEKTRLERGEMITLTVENLDEGETPFIESPFGKPVFFGSGPTRIARLAASYYDTPGPHTLRYGIEGGASETATVTIEAGTFRVQQLTIDPNVAASTRNEAAYAEFNRYFPPARATSNPEDLTKNQFVLPVKGRLTTSFGETRHVNGSPTSYRHSGIDIAAPQGTPIGAFSNGQITLSRHFILTGETVVIDHGRGLFSIYYHLASRDVKTGDPVAAGETIGTVGSTGFSTGPHLHFMTSYYNINLAPGRFLYDTVIRYDNYQTLFDSE